MVDIKLVRTNPDFVKEAVRKREMDLDAVIDEILEIDVKRRQLSAETDAMKARQNAASKQIPQIKKEGGDVAPIMAEMKELSAKIKEADVVVGELEEKQKADSASHKFGEIDLQQLEYAKHRKALDEGAKQGMTLEALDTVFAIACQQVPSMEKRWMELKGKINFMFAQKWVAEESPK